MGRRKAYKTCFTRPPKGVKPFQVYAIKAAKRQVGKHSNGSLSDTESAAHDSRVLDDIRSEGFRGFDEPPPSVTPLPPLTHHSSGSQRRELIVLSVFDGIGTALLVLRDLHLKVDKYYSSEIDEDCLRIQEHNFKDAIIKVGCVKGITTEMLDKMGSIGLLVGGSPCSELSKVNWRRKGLNDESGSGHLFYEFKRILNYLQTKSSDRKPLFWLFENTAAMDRKTEEEISRNLACSPTKHCSSNFKPMYRRRNFWGNIPDMQVPRERVSEWKPLQSYLQPPRIALVDIVPTITGNRASQCCGPDKLPPVLYNEKHEYLGPNECETLFGFPEHFTDCGLSISARSRCIGKSWSVDTVKSILMPLKSMF